MNEGAKKEQATIHPITASNQHIIADLSCFRTIEELRRSPIYHGHKQGLRRLFNEPKIYEAPFVLPRLNSFLRVVQWNIEYGRQLEGIIHVLNHHPVLRFADIIFLNEVDDGMARSGNLAVAYELSRALSAHAIYGVETLEMTQGISYDLRKGVREKVSLSDENTAALHGNAILTRYKFSNPKIVRLPICENNFLSLEKRMGSRVGVIADLKIGGARWTVATTHLDWVSTPFCRGKQMNAFLSGVERHVREQQSQSTIIGGDLNTHTFALNGRLRAIQILIRVLMSEPNALNRVLLQPHKKEPALKRLTQFGYETEIFNDYEATNRVTLPDPLTATWLPYLIKRLAAPRIGPSGLPLGFRLDWIAGRGVYPLRSDERIDQGTGVHSISPQTFANLTYKGNQIADHNPIAVDLVI